MAVFLSPSMYNIYHYNESKTMCERAHNNPSSQCSVSREGAKTKSAVNQQKPSAGQQWKRGRQITMEDKSRTCHLRRRRRRCAASHRDQKVFRPNSSWRVLFHIRNLLIINILCQTVSELEKPRSRKSLRFSLLI